MLTSPRTAPASRFPAFLRRGKWFGIPRWVVAGIVVGVFVCVEYVPRPPHVSGQVRAIVEGLRHGSVHVEPGAPPTVNPDRVRQVLGDRPIVVAILGGEELPPSGRPLVSPGQQICGEIADVVPTNIVIVFGNEPKRGYHASFCTGDEFDNPDNPVPAKNFDFPLIAAAETAWKYRDSPADLTPQVEEYVLAFDAQAAKDYPRSVPRRGAVPDELATSEIALSLGGIVAVCVALFFLLHLVARALTRRTPRGRRQLEMGARLSRIGDHVMAADPQQDKQAEVSRRYVLALQGFEAGEDVERQVKELERLMA